MKQKKRVDGFEISDTPQYENYQVLHPDGKLMFRTSKRRAEWYLTKNLAKLVEDKGPDSVLQLTFTPKGPGCADDPYYQQKMKNRCVVCGVTEKLTRHHIVPSRYRKLFPDELKFNSSYDVQPLCTECHHTAEDYYFELTTALAEEYGSPIDATIKFNRELAKIRGAASSLVRYEHLIPVEKQIDMYEMVERYLGRMCTQEDLQELSNSEIYDFTGFTTHSEALMKKLKEEDLQDFVFRWRKFFLDKMQPKYMPDHWVWDRPIHIQESGIHEPKGSHPNNL